MPFPRPLEIPDASARVPSRLAIDRNVPTGRSIPDELGHQQVHVKVNLPRLVPRMNRPHRANVKSDERVFSIVAATAP